MNIYIKRKRSLITYRVFSALIALTFVFSSIIPPQKAYSQSIVNLPAPGTMIPISISFNPAIVKGITLYPNNPLKFDFIVDPGDDNLQGEVLKDEAIKLIKYFMASLTVPEDEMWVNLSPYEKDRIIANGLSQTELGRDLLVQDYILKQLTASLMYPEEELGKDFWKRVYAKAQEKYGSSEIPMYTFNKVWIVPEKANVYVNGNNIFVVDNHLKVMLEKDYLALDSNLGHTRHGVGEIPENQVKEISDVSSEIIREVLIPEIEREVNEGKNFANLRQIYNSMILATWYKQNLGESLLGQVYVNQNKINGIDLEDKQMKEKIYNQYVEAFKKGVFNYIKEDYDEVTQQIIPRKYFSGGFAGDKLGVIGERLSEQREVRARPVTVEFRGLSVDSSSPVTSENWFDESLSGNILGGAAKTYDEIEEGKPVFTLTSLSRYEQMLENGKMLPPSDTKIENKSEALGLPQTNPNRIYFSTSIMETFLSASVSAATKVYELSEDPYLVLLKVRLPDADKLRPDEDTFASTARESLETKKTLAYEGEISLPGNVEVAAVLHGNFSRHFEYPRGLLEELIEESAIEGWLMEERLDVRTVRNTRKKIKDLQEEIDRILGINDSEEMNVGPFNYSSKGIAFPVTKNEQSILDIIKVEGAADDSDYFSTKSLRITWDSTDKDLLLAAFRNFFRKTVVSHHMNDNSNNIYVRAAQRFVSAIEKGENEIYVDRFEASSPLSARKESSTAPGGIDLNPNNLNLNVQGDEIKVDFSNPQILNNISVDGFIPVIINVAPITSIPILLGESEEQSNDFSLSQLN